MVSEKGGGVLFCHILALDGLMKDLEGLSWQGVGYGFVWIAAFQGEKVLIGDVILENIVKKVYILTKLFVGSFVVDL